MTEQAQPPSLDEQFNEIMSLIITRCHDFDKEVNLSPEDPTPMIPRCEMGLGPAKLGALAGKSGFSLLMGNYHKDWKGDVTIGARECPICGSLQYSNAIINDIVKCIRCKENFIW